MTGRHSLPSLVIAKEGRDHVSDKRQTQHQSSALIPGWMLRSAQARLDSLEKAAHGS